MAPSVQFVSKPVDPPINDGTKHIVLSLARHLSRYAPRVMTSRDVTSVGDGIAVDAIFDKASSYAPSLLNNLRAAKHLALGRRANLWNFVFAPNDRSSQMGRVLSRLRGCPVVQTIASRPKSFDHPSRLLFGDIVVAQSEDTKRRFLSALGEEKKPGASSHRFEVIPPPLGTVRIPTLEDTHVVRQALGVAMDAPLLLYPGDLEVSRGAVRVASVARQLAHRHPNAVVVFAYRDKTPSAADIAAKLEGELLADLPPSRFRFVREAPDILSLVRTSAVLVFPVDELYGKVDLPIVLLEAMALGTPVLTYGEGPLGGLCGVEFVSPDDEAALVEVALSLIDDHGRRAGRIAAQERAVNEQYAASAVARRYESLYDELLRAKS